MAELARIEHWHALDSEQVRERIHAMAGREIGAEPDEFAADENLIELGLASIALMRIQAAFVSGGAAISFSDLVANPTVDAWTALAIERTCAKATEFGAPGRADSIESSAFPLTDIQRAYWLGRHSHFELGGVAAHGYIEAQCDNLDIDRLEDALNMTIAAHPMLRAIINADGTQRILDDVPRLAISRGNLETFDGTRKQQCLQAIRDDMEHEVLPADQWPLFRVHASRVSADRHVLHLSFDILVFDLKSLEIWLGDWWTRYSNPDAAVAIPTARFRDHVTALEARASLPATEEARQYWRKRAESMPLGPSLPLSQPLEALTPPRFARLQTVLNGDDWQRLQDAIRKRGLTASATLLAAYAHILSLWSERGRFTLTTTLFNRPVNDPASNNVIGDFTSLTLVETDPGAASNFLTLSKAIQAQLWRDLDHSFVSGVEVLGMVAAANGLHNRAIMPYVFTSALGTGRSYLDAFSGFGKITRAAVQTPQTLLDHQALEHEGHLILNWDHVEAAFPPGLICDLAGLHLDLLRSLARGEEAWSALDLPSLPAEQAVKRLQINNTAWQPAADVTLLHGPFLRQVVERPDAVAVIADDGQWTYAEIDRASTCLAHILVCAGANHQQPIAVLLPKGWQQIVAVLAILKAGSAYLPIDPSLPPRRIETLLEESGSDLVLTLPQGFADDDFARRTINVGLDLFDATGDLQNPVSLPQASAEDLAYVIFTSGSTGKPKGVAVQHSAALNTILDINARFCVGPDDRCLMVSSLSFDLSVYDIFGLLGAGGSIVISASAPTPGPDAWLALLKDNAVTLWNSAPALMQLFHDHLADRKALAELSRLRLVMLSGDWLPLPLCRSIRAIDDAPRLVSLGGATEASIWSIMHEVDQVETGWTSIPYGRPLSNQTIHVLDEKFSPRPDHAVGEIFIGGLGLAQGYWLDPEKTAERFIHHPVTGERLYRTGDFGRWHPDETVEFLGRRDGQVKVNGLRIELGEVETAIAEDATIRQVAVVATGMPGKGSNLTAFLTLHGDSRYREDMLRRSLVESLPVGMIPSSFVVIQHLPLSINGKIDRKALEIKARDLLVSMQAAAMPVATETEGRIKDIWQDLLDQPVNSITTSFFRAGGNSLLATRLASRLSQAFGRPFSVIRVFEHPTIRTQAIFFCKDAEAEPSETLPLTTRTRRFHERPLRQAGEHT